METQDRLLAPWPSDNAGLPRMTEDEFIAWCDEDTRAEWVDGEVIMMSPVNEQHAELFDWLYRLLGDFVEARRLGRVRAHMQVRFAAQRTRRVPDILFVSAERSGLFHETHIEGPPDLIVEVVSPDSVARDYRTKYHEYQAAAVREYWIVDPMWQRLDAYRLHAAPIAEGNAEARNEYQPLEERDGVIASTVVPCFYLRPSWLWSKDRPAVLTVLHEMGV
jgi:Uma2 family endonuclease